MLKDLFEIVGLIFAKRRARRRAPQSSNLGNDYFLVGATLDFAVSRRMVVVVPHLLRTRVYIAQPYARIDASENPCI